MSNPVRENPNATTAAGSTGVAVFIVWLIGHLGVTVTAEVAVVIAGGLTTLVLAFARYGLIGVWSRFLRGSGSSR